MIPDAFKKLLEDFNTIEQTITKQEIEVEVETPVKVRLLAELKARQLTDPKTEVLVVKNNKVITIDKKDLPRYVDNGWALAEAHGGKHTTTGRSMTKGEEGEKERLVKGMKKNKSDFKKRYGKDADAVMYATATKNAMEDDLEELDTKGLQRFPANIMKGKKKEKGDTDRDKAYFKMQQKRKEKQTAESEIGVRREDLAGMLVNRFNQFFRKATPEEIKAMAQLLDYKTRDEDKNFVKIEKEDIEEAMFEAEEKSPLSAAILSTSDIQFKVTDPLVVSNSVWFLIASKRTVALNISDLGSSFCNTFILIPLTDSSKS